MKSSSAAYTAVDIETTGFQVYEADILEIGAVRFRGGRPTGERFVQLARPRIPIPADATSVHGMTDEDFGGAPGIGETIAGFVEFLGDDLVVCHNARFDLPFLAREIHAHGLSVRCDVADTLPLARSQLSLGSYSLGPVCQHLGVTTKGLHRAEADATATGRAFWRLLELGADPGAALEALRGKARFEPMSFDDFADLPAIGMVAECPPGTAVALRYAAAGDRPRSYRVIVEFYSRTRSAAYLTARSPGHRGERCAYRLDRVLEWS